MLHQFLRLTGAERKLHALRLRFEREAELRLRHGKAMLIQVVMVAILGMLTAILMFVGLIAGLVAAYLWLEPLVGGVAAAGIICGSVLLVGLAVGIAAYLVASGLSEEPSDRNATMAADEPDRGAAGAAAMGPDTAKPTGDAATAAAAAFPNLRDLEPLLALAGMVAARHLARGPVAGAAELYPALAAIGPSAQDAYSRAADVVKNGDRSAVLAILGAAVAIGWMLSKAATSQQRQS